MGGVGTPPAAALRASARRWASRTSAYARPQNDKQVQAPTRCAEDDAASHMAFSCLPGSSQQPFPGAALFPPGPSAAWGRPPGTTPARGAGPGAAGSAGSLQGGGHAGLWVIPLLLGTGHVATGRDVFPTVPHDLPMNSPARREAGGGVGPGDVYTAAITSSTASWHMPPLRQCAATQRAARRTAGAKDGFSPATPATNPACQLRARVGSSATCCATPTPLGAMAGAAAAAMSSRPEYSSRRKAKPSESTSTASSDAWHVNPCAFPSSCASCTPSAARSLAKASGWVGQRPGSSMVSEDWVDGVYVGQGGQVDGTFWVRVHRAHGIVGV